MIVPQFWAEGRVQGRHNGRQVTVRRFGWSDDSQVQAQVSADARAAEAWQRVVSGENLKRREPKVAYNGAAGVPIREEIISRHGETIITRNAYGALCLNSPNVLFADIDFMPKAPLALGCVTCVLTAALVTAIGWRTLPTSVTIALALGAFGLGWPIANIIYRGALRFMGGIEGVEMARISRFAAEHAEWNLRIYRTPAGLRLLVTHQPFDPNDAAVRAFFSDIGADPIYARMCLNQQCFRARVSPKPWRIGIGDHIRPRRGVWPVQPDRLAVRRDWIASYEDAATGFASCTYIDSVGSGHIHSKVAQVVKLHDELSRANSGLPIA